MATSTKTKAKTTFLPWVFFEGKVVPAAEAKIPVMTHGFQYGIGCFGGIRGYWNADDEELYVFRLEDHFRRLLDSCRILLFQIPHDVQDLIDLSLGLTRKNAPRQNIYFRPMVYSASLRLTPTTHDVDHEFVLYQMPLEDYLATDRGLRTTIASWHRIDDNIIPARAKATGGYLNSALAKSEALLNGFDEAILLNRNGYVSEGSAENLFLVRRDRLITAPVSEDILEGITRRSILHLAREELGIDIEERPIGRTELYVADELFFTGTGAQVAWIEEVDRRPIGDRTMGPITARLRDLFWDIVRGKNPKYRHWNTPVYGTAARKDADESRAAAASPPR